MSLTSPVSARLETQPDLYFQSLARLEQRHWWWRLMAAIETAWLDRILTGGRNGVALDLGCGTGAALERLAKRPELEHILGVEPVAEALAHSNSKRPSSESNTLLPRLIRAEGNHIPLAAESVDLVLCFDVIQHLPIERRPGLLLEVRRVLRRGGHLLLRTNAPPLFQRSVASSVEEERPIRPSHLVEWCDYANLTVLKHSRANIVGSLYDELRSFVKVGQGGDQASSGHPAGRGLVVESVGRHDRSPRLAQMIAAWEGFWVGRWGVSLPIGHSFWLHAQA